MKGIVIRSMNEVAIDKVRGLESQALRHPQVELDTDHFLHAGLYSRTIRIPAGVVITGALIRIPTLLILHGACVVYIDGEPVEMTGYNVIRAEAGRKQAVFAIADTHMTMVFRTGAVTVEEAENEFTAEADRLMTRKGH